MSVVVNEPYTGPERRRGDRRAWGDDAVPADTRGKTFNRQDRVRSETMSVEAQAALDHAAARLTHAALAHAKMAEELREARTALLAARRAARLALWSRS